MEFNSKFSKFNWFFSALYDFELFDQSVEKEFASNQSQLSVSFLLNNDTETFTFENALFPKS